MKKLLAITLIFYFCGFSAALAQDGDRVSKVGTTVAQFLKIGPSARSIGMGGAFTSVANDVSAIHHNPAGLSRIYANEAMFTHVDWLAGTSFDYGAVVLNLGSFGALGAMVASFQSGEMEVRTVQQPDGTGERFDTQDIAAGLAYSRNLTDKFSIGFTGKFIYQRIWHMTATSIALDVGTLFETPFWGIRLGASISNFGNKMKLEGRDSKFATDPDPDNIGNVEIVNAQYEMLAYNLPLRFQVGFAKDIEIGEYNRLTLALDAIQPNDNFEAVNTGFEYGWKELVFLRAGYKSLFQDETEEGLTYGLGANIRLAGQTHLRVDWAYADWNRLESAQKFSLSIRF